MNDISRQKFESDFMEIFGIHPGVITPDNIHDLDIELTDLEALWQASKSEPITLPPMLDLEGRTGRGLLIAGAHNSAIAMCSMAITGAGYTSVCSPPLENEESP